MRVSEFLELLRNTGETPVAFLDPSNHATGFEGYTYSYDAEQVSIKYCTMYTREPYNYPASKVLARLEVFCGQAEVSPASDINVRRVELAYIEDKGKRLYVAVT